MINITDKKNCCGCQACGDACPKGAISFATDEEGFWYPKVDKAKCVNCGLCEKTCPQLHAEELKKNDFAEPKAMAANHKNIEVRFDSTSGGMFTAFAEWAFRNGYYVGGAVFTETWGAKNFITNNPEDLLKLRNTKYIQSDAQGFYGQVRKLLEAGEKVLVCNLPCQIAALKRCLGKQYKNLLTVDLFCRGINSPLVFRKFLDSLEREFESKVVYVKPKSKELGWHNLTLKVVFANGKTYYGTRDVDFFTKAFLGSNCITRPACYDCQFKGFPRIADVSIGDFWRQARAKSKAELLDDDLGTSAILVNSKKGQMLIDAVEKKLRVEDVKLDEVVGGNPALVMSIGKERVNRKSFYDRVNTSDFKEVVDFLFPLQRVSVLRKLRRIAGVWKREVESYAQWHLWPILQFAYYNLFCKSVQNVSLSDGRVLYVTRFCDIELHKGAMLRLNGELVLGQSVFRRTQAETRLRILPGGKMFVDGNRSFGDGANIEVFSSGELIVKKGPWTNVNLCIICQDKILLDEWSMIGRDVTIRDNNGGHPIGIYGSRTHMPVVIGKHAWLTSNCTVMMGVKIGDGAIVGSNALVSSSIPANCVANGAPAKVTQRGVLWKM